MSKPSWPARPPVNGNSDVNDVANATKQCIEISVGHLKRHITNKQGFARGVLRSGFTWARVGRARTFRVGEGNVQTTTFEELLVEVIDRTLRSCGVLEFDVGKPIPGSVDLTRSKSSTDPLLIPRTSLMRRNDLIVPNRSNSFCKSFSVTSKKRFPTKIVGLGLGGSRVPTCALRVRPSKGRPPSSAPKVEVCEVALTALSIDACSAASGA